MEFVPTTHGIQPLVYNGYIFSKSKVYGSGSINWKCHNYLKEDTTHCQITCTTIGNEFLVGREAPMYHEDANGNMIHDPPAIEKKLAMHMAQKVLNQFLNLLNRYKRFVIKPCSNMFSSRALILFKTIQQFPNLTIVNRNLSEFVEEKCKYYQRQFISTLDGLRFLLFDTEGSDRIIAFASDRQFE